MPKPTFFHLDEEKRETLLKAAKAEFSRVPLYDALIANIIKAAGIPRGSFYQYFEDKEDLYFYLLEEHGEAAKKHFLTHLESSNGDLFATFLKEYDRMLCEFSKKENRHFFRNTFLNMNQRVEDTMTHTYNKEMFSQELLGMKREIDQEHLDILHEEELEHVLEILIAVMMHNLIRSFAEDLSYEQAVQNFKSQLDLLKRGLQKDD